jgi:futalosine hydrolase
VILVAAAPSELSAILIGLDADPSPPALWQIARPRSDIHLLHCGVTKSNAAGALARTLSGPELPSAVINLGIAGSLPGTTPPLPPGTALAASASVFADEGLTSDIGYQSIAQMGFPLNQAGTASYAADAVLLDALRSHVDAVGPIACVSTCSGTDALAREVAHRTGAVAECMEGAALALICARIGVPFCEVRTISNFTGARAAQAWDIPKALARLTNVVRAVFASDAR